MRALPTLRLRDSLTTHHTPARRAEQSWVAHISLVLGYVRALPPVGCTTRPQPSTLQPAGRNNRSPARQSRVRARGEPSPVRDGTASQPMGGAPLQGCILRLSISVSLRRELAWFFDPPLLRVGRAGVEGTAGCSVLSVAQRRVRQGVLAFVSLHRFLRVLRRESLFPIPGNFGYLRSSSPLFFLEIPSPPALP